MHVLPYSFLTMLGIRRYCHLSVTGAQLPALGVPEESEEKDFFFISKKGFTTQEHQEKGFSLSALQKLFLAY